MVLIMATTNEDCIDILNNLIETCKDGANGFKEASEGVTDADVKALFLQYATQRATFATELQAEVAALGGDPETSGTTAASLHRGWINIKSAVVGNDRKAVLEECERGEDHAKAAYEKASKGCLTGNPASVVARQHSAVQEAHDRVKALRDAC